MSSRVTREYTEQFTHVLTYAETNDLLHLALSVDDKEWWNEIVSYRQYMIDNDVEFVVLKYRDIPDPNKQLPEILYGKRYYDKDRKQWVQGI